MLNLGLFRSILFVTTDRQQLFCVSCRNFFLPCFAMPGIEPGIVSVQSRSQPFPSDRMGTSCDWLLDPPSLQSPVCVCVCIFWIAFLELCGVLIMN